MGLCLLDSGTLKRLQSEATESVGRIEYGVISSGEFYICVLENGTVRAYIEEEVKQVVAVKSLKVPEIVHDRKLPKRSNTDEDLRLSVFYDNEGAMYGVADTSISHFCRVREPVATLATGDDLGNYYHCPCLVGTIVGLKSAVRDPSLLRYNKWIEPKYG